MTILIMIAGLFLLIFMVHAWRATLIVFGAVALFFVMLHVQQARANEVPISVGYLADR